MSTQPTSDPGPSSARTTPPTRPYREVTLSSILLGVVIGAVMNAAITYAGLKIGFTIVGSAIIAVLGFGVLRGVLRKGSILEVNIAQTIGSAVNTSNAGVIFTVPVLLLLGYTLDFTEANFWWLTLAAMAGAVLGVAFIVPLRTQMLDIERLRFPSGTAVAAILKSPGAGAKKTIVLLIGALIGAVIILPASLPQITLPAPADQIDALVTAKRITPAQAERARFIASISTPADVPADWIARGTAAQAAYDAALIARAQAPKPTPLPPTSDDDRFAKALAKFAQGSATRDDLQAFWPKVSLPGYKRLGDALGLAWLADDRVNVTTLLGLPGYIPFTLAIAPFAIGAGFLTGRAGLVVLAGGLLATFVITPLAWTQGWLSPTLLPAAAGDAARAIFNRPLGIGLLMGGAIIGLVFALPAVREAFRTLLASPRSGPRTASTPTTAIPQPSRLRRDDMSPKTLIILVVVGIATLLFAAENTREWWQLTGQAQPAAAGLLAFLPPWAATLVTVAVAIAWIWFAGLIIAQCTGMTDWSPISGMALLTIVLAMFLVGTGNVVLALALGVALCVAISLASDMMTDLKTGYLVGSRPVRQQWVELGAAALGPVISMATLLIIAQANAARGEPPVGGADMPAPQAMTLLSIINGIQGGEMPYALYGLGAILGILLGLGAFPGLGVLVGLSMFLPTHYVMVYGVGCLLQMLVARVKGKSWAEEWGVPFCAGLIVGEALLSLSVNAFVLANA
jgi:uncharacterized oligopeptide transporter (OPT) family protein